jgi:acyl dehydratase
MVTDLNVDAKITDEMITKARSRLGEETAITEAWHTEATRDTIRRWAEAIGDNNPLWVDPKYAAGTGHGTIIGPPTFLFSCNQGPAHRGRGAGGFRGFPGIHRFWAHEEWDWRLPIRRGDEIHGFTKEAEIIEHTSRLARRSFENITEQRFLNQNGELIANHRMGFVNTERSTAAAIGRYKDFKQHSYTREDIQKINDDIDMEELRGATPRYWEDVSSGDQVPWVVKGPLTSTEIVTFITGWGGPFIIASEIGHRYLRDHPHANVSNRITNAPDFPERCHWDDDFAREVGAPAAYDFGSQRVAWLCHAVTNWMGDNGFLRHLKAKLIKFNVLGDTTWCQGRVVDTTVEDGEHLVHLELWGENQRGEVTITGQASVRLPSKG